MSASLLPIIQSTILKSVQGISSHVKFQTLVPAIEVVVSDTGHDVNDELLALLLASIDETAASGLNNPDDSYWSLYTKIIRHLFREGKLDGVSRDLFAYMYTRSVLCSEVHSIS